MILLIKKLSNLINNIETKCVKKSNYCRNAKFELNIDHDIVMKMLSLLQAWDFRPKFGSNPESPSWRRKS